ncbi:helix-turn-helix transcriptional regulator, partial [Peribacillus sp. SIMBA_075]|uniref:helix-turn-helix transcriptional regulator n=1 Tax=Peribacillus sp. SIMBA_075 TaxID=3085813 RepID=UPI00397D8ACD
MLNSDTPREAMMLSCIEMGRELRRIRLSARLSQAALARKVGVARSTVSRMETGAHS